MRVVFEDVRVKHRTMPFYSNQDPLYVGHVSLGSTARANFWIELRDDEMRVLGGSQFGKDLSVAVQWAVQQLLDGRLPTAKPALHPSAPLADAIVERFKRVAASHVDETGGS